MDEAGSLCPYLLLLQADHRAVAAAPPLPLESCDFLRFDAQDFLVLLVLQFQFLHGKEQPLASRGARCLGTEHCGLLDGLCSQPALWELLKKKCSAHHPLSSLMLRITGSIRATCPCPAHPSPSQMQQSHSCSCQLLP